MPQYNPSATLKYLSRESFNLAIGVGSQTISPPANATHMIFGRGTLGGGETIRYRATIDGVNQEWLMNDPTTLTALVVMPICTDAAAHIFLRSVTTAADQYTVYYLGPR